LPNSIEKQIDLKCDGMEWDGRGTILKYCKWPCIIWMRWDIYFRRY
jgi:hypothetical protein